MENTYNPHNANQHQSLAGTKSNLETLYGKKTQRNPLVQWTKQEWTTRSGLPSHITGERYLPRIWCYN